MPQLPFLAPLSAYEERARELLAAHAAGDEAALRELHHTLPRFLDPAVTWLPRRVGEDEIRETSLSLEDTRLSVARSHGFMDWAALVEWVSAVHAPGSRVRTFESAVEHVIHGDADGLRHSVREHPDLLHARSTRRTPQDPSVHGATLLHYVAANGVESYRQLAPTNGVTIARILLEAGAEVDALAGMYGGGCTTLSMLVSSAPPDGARTQVPLVHCLVDFGAEVEGRGDTRWRSPLMTALAFGYVDAARALVARGARVVDLTAAAGLGLVAECNRLLPFAGGDARHRALALAAQLGHLDVTRLLLDAGEAVDRFNPDGLHSHATPLHHAALGGHLGVVQLLVERGARLDVRDTLWDGTALDWARHANRDAVAEFLSGLAH